jgi:hypothetical protein
MTCRRVRMNNATRAGIRGRKSPVFVTNQKLIDLVFYYGIINHQISLSE